MKTMAGMIAAIFFFAASVSFAQSKGPKIPLSGKGMTGSAGVGFVDFLTVTPVGQFKMDRGIYAAASIERPFNFANLHLVLTISHMSANGEATYNYKKGATTFREDNLPFKAAMFDLGLGVKLKLIDNYWFRPYIGGGGLGGYHELTFNSTPNLTSQGTGYKTKDTVMASGYYGEAGLEVEFTDRFGIQLAARLSDYTSKTVETLASQRLQFRTETYYFSALIGF